MALKSKVCSGCGWEYPIHSPRHICTFCKAVLTTGICTMCGEESNELNDRGLCPTCHKKRHVEDEIKHYNKNLKETTDQFNEWLAKVKRVPKEYPTLTQDQWLAACKHFDGCAMCGDDSVDTRGFFIAFKDGGRYCDWNIIPLCDKCATYSRVRTNPFKIMHRRLGINPRNSKETNLEYAHNNPKRLKKIVDYLQPILEEAINDS